MKVFKILLAAMFFAASFSVHAGNHNAVTQIITKNQGNGKMNAVTNVMKPKAAKSNSRTLRPVK